MEDLWKRFESWLADHWPEGLASLHPPASDAQIAALEAGLGVKLPADYIACLKIHNGQDPEVAMFLFPGGDFLSCEEVLAQWGIWKGLVDGGEFDGIESTPDDGIKNDWFNRRWIPVTHNGSGDHVCIDLDPAAGGRAGQVISMWHDDDQRALLASGFGAWFTALVEGVLSGRYAYDAAYGGMAEVS